MLSLHQAIEIKESILAYLRATFTFQEKRVEQAFEDFIHDPTEGMFKGPYISLKTGFVKASEEERVTVPLEIQPSWPPYDHQVKSWHRLSCRDQDPSPTIVTTGTGSGKTESFLYPVLDYCYEQRDRRGIKVIIMYPMNALASDQARRLAEAIYDDERLKGKITAGLFIGEGRDAATYPRTMERDHIIENREAILASPPDILLTNFKMLDYGLMKSTYHDLWHDNLKDPELLRFLVLDELHTYDGAQGTDVANLIRRLKLKLSVPEGQLCPVGTSATIGSGDTAMTDLASYASRVFGEQVDESAIITENRMTPEDFFGDQQLDSFRPRMISLREVSLKKDEAFEDFLARQINIWQLDPEDLAGGLRELEIVKDLVSACMSAPGIHRNEDLIRELLKRNAAFGEIEEYDPKTRTNPRKAVLESLFALISMAQEQSQNGRKSPFLYLQVQLWIRELSGVQRHVQETPQFVWRDQAEQDSTIKALPPWFCRECGSSGWLAVKHDNKDRFEQGINDVYEKFFSNDKHIFFVLPQSTLSQLELAESGYAPDDALSKTVSGEDLEFYDSMEVERLEVLATRKLTDKGYNDHVCPFCNSRNTMSIIGTRVATLSSIAMSQTLSTNLDPATEKDRKVLAFTNSVQDAAHQAGFVEARNYRFTLRSSLQQVINQMEESVALTELADRFLAHWKEASDERGEARVPAYLYRFFPKDYLGKAAPEDYEQHGRYDPDFLEEFDLRLRWEIYSEFGFSSMLGRTLEKTRTSGAYFPKPVLRQVWDEILPWLEGNIPMNPISEQEFLPFLSLLLHRIRIRGALSHPYLEKFRTRDLKLWDLNWSRDSRHFLNRYFGKKARLPKLFTPFPERRGILDSSHTTKVNWFHRFFRQSFPMVRSHVDLVNEFYVALSDALTAAGVFDVRQAEELNNYALNPALLQIRPAVTALRCDTCGDEIYSGDPDLVSEGGLCLKYRCQGHYQLPSQELEDNYYRAVYNRKRSPRIFARDHTGLLGRKDREELEESFKKRPRFDSPNAMVATSTLEMGIDIGTLNTAYNNSVPPLPSNFLQRIGRAGRSSGSALVVNFVQNKAHDLYYFSDPYDMMDGEVHTPGCFLEAREILRRHFFAFCIDSWSSHDPGNNHIPRTINDLKLMRGNVQDPQFLMVRILDYLEEREDELFNRFRDHYAEEVDPEVFEELLTQLHDNRFYYSHKKIFENLQEEMRNIEGKRKEIDERIRREQLGKEDPERLELEGDKKSLGRLLRSMNARMTLEHLTNVGALPNYAFPETGVTLQGTVMGNRAEGSHKPPKSKDYEIVRSAEMALRELAPDNHFYSQGHRLQITGINTSDWTANQSDSLQRMRFCSKCDHIEIDNLAKPSYQCPKCGDPSWQAASNTHTFARLTTVKSFNSSTKARLDDQADERENERYHQTRHFEFDQKKSLGSKIIRKIPFGIEFVKQVSVLETNLGRQDVVHSRKIQIEGREVPAHGFVTCKHCGKSSSNHSKKDYKYHYGYCKHREKKYEGKPDEVFEEVFFYRNMDTEALKVLIPVQEVDGELETHLFQAGIELGLRKYYRGNPQHIRVSPYSEFNRNTNRFDRFLVLYDKVPGGTGYLQQLFEQDQINSLLTLAYEAIRDCECQNQGKDGCYRCVYSYGNQYFQDDLSRELAERRFKSIIDRLETWESETKGLTEVAASGKVEESELEERFIRSLKRYAEVENDWIFEERNDGEGISYTFSKPGLAYQIQPQVTLGKSDGVTYRTRTDFLLTCTEYIPDPGGEDRREEAVRIAIYLDGFAYHASEQNNRVESDVKIRDSISQQQHLTSWTLTWTDLDLFDLRFGEDMPANADCDELGKQLIQPWFRNNRKALKTDPSVLLRMNNNMERLLKRMETPVNSEIYTKGSTKFLMLFQKNFGLPSYPPNEWEFAFQNPDSSQSYLQQKKSLDGLVRFQGIPKNEMFSPHTIIHVKERRQQSRVQFHQLERIDREHWQAFWTWFNLAQPLELVRWPGEQMASDQDQGIQPVVALEDVLDLLDIPVLIELATRMHESGKIMSEKDIDDLFEFTSGDGQRAEAEFIIHTQKLFFGPGSEEDKSLLVQEGFNEVSEDALQDIEI